MASSNKVIVGYALPPKKEKTFAHVLKDPANTTVEYRRIDLARPLEEQGPWDVIIHKIVEDRAQMDLVDAYLARHPETHLVGDFKGLRMITDRASMSRHLKAIGTEEPEAGVHTPPFLVLEEVPPSTDELKKVMARASFGYPFIAKPVVACGNAESHHMVVVTSEKDLKRELIKQPMVFQEFINHGAILYKVYVLGDMIEVFERPSLPNLSVASKTLTFDSQMRYPSCKDFHTARLVAGRSIARGLGVIPAGEDSDSSDSDSDDGDGQGRKRAPSPPPPGTLQRANTSKLLFAPNSAATQVRPPLLKERVRLAAKAIDRRFNLEAFGFDAIFAQGTGRMYIVDVNYLSSYKEIEDFPARFHAFMAEVKAEHDARAAHAATAQVEEEEDDPEIAPTLANLRSMNINASLGADPEHEPLPPALFHRETSSMMCACSDCAARLSMTPSPQVALNAK